MKRKVTLYAGYQELVEWNGGIDYWNGIGQNLFIYMTL